MKRITLVLFMLLQLTTQRGAAQAVYPFQDKKLSVEQRVSDLIVRMTLEEKIDLLSGYRDFYFHPCERLGIPAFKLADGPLGVSSWGLFGRATAFPSGLSLAASWNKKAAAELGAVYAQEWRARGIHFMLAPGVNIYRASKGARNFEYYGEDPYLSSAMVVPFIKAVQKGGVVATVKHFAANDQEYDRYNVSTELSERALHEIYLPPFKAAVLKADVKAVMTGYNPVYGVYCTENKQLIDILKKDWGFGGILMSDWGCTYSTKAATNGLDLEMGSNNWLVRRVLMPLIEKGEISEEVINDKVRRIYGTCISMGFFDRPQQDTLIRVFNEEANRMALEVASEGIILLKNSKKTLPLREPKVIAVIGPTANPSIISDRAHNVNGTVYGGGGSSKVHPWYLVNALEGIRQEFPGATVLYAEGISNKFKRDRFQSGRFRTKDGKAGLEANYFVMDSSKTKAVSNDLIAQQAFAAGRTIVNTPTAGGNKIDNSTDKNLILSRTDNNVNYEWWGTPFNEPRLGEDYRVTWDGYVDADKSDSLIFFVDAQGGYRLWIDGELLLDASQSQSFDSRTAAVAVRKGDAKHVQLEFYSQCSSPAEIRMGYAYRSDIDFSEATRIAAQADVVVFCGGLDGSIELEGRDRPFNLPYGQDLLINRLAAVNPNTVVAIHAGGGVNMLPWIDNVSAVVHALYPGQEGGRALARILCGKVNPSAKLPFTIEKRWEDSPACGNYDETRREKKVYYNEGVFTGYRGYDQKGIKPLFPFGFGLSYTTFDYSDLKIEVRNKKNADVAVSFRITNSGDRPGAEVAQLYIRDLKSKEPRPLKELKGFDKVWLNPGESQVVTLVLAKEDWQYYNEKQHKWVLEPGDFLLQVGASSRDIRLEGKVKL